MRDAFSEALRSLNAGSYKSAVVMARGALQAAMREQHAAGNNLTQEIDDLAARHIIPAALRDWAHAIGDGGDLDASSEPDKTIDTQDVEELITLAESIFLQLYVIPRQGGTPPDAPVTAKDTTMPAPCREGANTRAGLRPPPVTVHPS